MDSHPYHLVQYRVDRLHSACRNLRSAENAQARNAAASVLDEAFSEVVDDFKRAQRTAENLEQECNQITRQAWDAVWNAPGLLTEELPQRWWQELVAEMRALEIAIANASKRSDAYCTIMDSLERRTSHEIASVDKGVAIRLQRTLRYLWGAHQDRMSENSHQLSELQRDLGRKKRDDLRVLWYEDGKDIRVEAWIDRNLRTVESLIEADDVNEEELKGYQEMLRDIVTSAHTAHTSSPSVGEDIALLVSESIVVTRLMKIRKMWYKGVWSRSTIVADLGSCIDTFEAILSSVRESLR